MLGSGSATPVTSAINPTVFSKPASLELVFFLHLMLTIRVADPVGSYRDPDLANLGAAEGNAEPDPTLKYGSSSD